MKLISVKEFRNVLQNKTGKELFLDVREPAEYKTEHIPHTENVPLSGIMKSGKIQKDAEQVYLICKSGKRSAEARKILAGDTGDKFICVEGGIDAWKSENYPTGSSGVKVWSLERQVRFAAGTLVVTGVLCSQFVSGAFIWLSCFVGAGLIFAAVTDTCGMAMLLARMPWNR